jgi:hypothetical protein
MINQKLAEAFVFSPLRRGFVAGSQIGVRRALEKSHLDAALRPSLGAARAFVFRDRRPVQHPIALP